MRKTATPILSLFTLVAVACSDGSERLKGIAGSGPDATSGDTTTSGSSSSATNGGAGGAATGVGPSSSTSAGGVPPGGMGGGSGGAGGSSGGAGGMVILADGGSTPQDAGGGLRRGPFKMLVLSKTLEFHHDSIPACQQMLRDLGATPDASLPPGAQPGSTWDVTIANEDLSDFTDEKLAAYEMIF